MLEYWHQSNSAALRSIHRERLLVLETKKLSDSLEQLEAFLSLSPNSLERQRAHQHKSKEVPNPLERIDADYFSKTVAPYQDIYQRWINNHT